MNNRTNLLQGYLQLPESGDVLVITNPKLKANQSGLAEEAVIILNNNFIFVKVEYVV